MKKKNKWLFVLFPVLLCSLATAGYSYLFVLRDDTTAPQITVASDVLEVSVTADEAALLEGVSAFDETDGDVTASILVEGVSNITEEDTATITYAAFDAAGNVSKATRTLQYTDYESPKFGLTNALVFRNISSVDVLKYVTAEDQLDGDISNRVKGTLVSDTTNLSYTGSHQVEFRVTNSMGDTEHLTLPVDVYATTTYNATVELSAYLVRLKKYADFEPENYLEKLTVGTTEYTLKNQNPAVPAPPETEEEAETAPEAENREIEVRTYTKRYVEPSLNEDPYVRIVNVEMDSDVNTSIPGVYSVAYTVTMDGNYVGFTRLNVVVEE